MAAGAVAAVDSAFRRSLFHVSLVSAAAAIVLAGSAAGHTRADNKRAARRDASALLGKVRLPSGALRAPRRPTGALELKGAGFLPATPELVDLHDWWRVPGSMPSVYRWVLNHRPSGSMPSATGSYTKGGQALDQAVEFSFPPVPGVVSLRSLVVNVVSLPGGSAAVRVDGAAVWLVPRPRRERVPRTALVLTVTRGASLRLNITDTAKVRRVAAMLDRLQIIQPGGFTSCPFETPAPTITFTFRARLGGPPLARARMLASGPEGPCSPISFSVRGRHEPALLAEPSFLRKAGHILGTALR